MDSFRNYFYTFFIVLSSVSCADKYMSAEERKNAIVNLSNKEIDIDRNGEAFLVRYIYKTCKFSFEYSSTNIEFLSKNSSNCGEGSISDTIIDSLKNDARESLMFIKQNKINSVSNKFKKDGIFLKLYMKDLSVYLFCPDTNLLVNDNFKKYINSAKKIDSNWYYKQTDY